MNININELENNNPIDTFKQWLNDAQKSEINDPNAMALATIGADGYPQNRMVLLKSASKDGFIFYTNKTSNKAKSIEHNNNVALLFHWKTLRRQVRITGKIETVDTAQNQQHFNQRATISQLGAWASKQSQPLDSRDTLIKRVNEMQEKFKDTNEIPCPDFWGGYMVVPEKIELWIDGE